MNISLDSRIDLHAHSTCSDGRDTPEALIQQAVQAGLSVVALTDHDSVMGWDDAATAAKTHGVKLLRGEEVSCHRGTQSIHVLAYLHDPTAAGLRDEAEKSRTARRTRAKKMVELLGQDFDLTWDDVLREVRRGQHRNVSHSRSQSQADASVASESTIGRPHIADALVAKGIVPTRDAAFEDMMSSSSPYYVPVYATDPVSAVKAIRAAGGVPIIAHPGRDGDSVSEDLLDEMVDAGMLGIEIEHRENSIERKKFLYGYARDRDLIITGSSDFHGVTGKPNRLGENTTTAPALERILQASRSGLALI